MISQWPGNFVSRWPGRRAGGNPMGGARCGLAWNGALLAKVDGTLRTMPTSLHARRCSSLLAAPWDGRGGFTLIEALIASALLGFSLIVMFGFHSQAVRSNMHARKMTDCTYLAQLKMEQLQSVPWTADSTPAALQDLGADPTTWGDPWQTLMQLHDAGTGTGGPVNSRNERVPVNEAGYWVSWQSEAMDTDNTWVRLRVRCVYQDRTFNQWRGTTISAYRFRDS